MTQDGMRVLLVESNAQDREQYKGALADLVNERGVVLLEAGSGKEGLKICRGESPACAVISDNLGDMDARAFLDEVAGESARIPFPVVVVLSQRSRKAVSAVTGSGATDWLFKDQVGSVLGRVVGYAVERQVTEKRLAEQRVLFRTFLTGVPGLLVLKNKELRYEAANPAFCQFVGKSPEEVLSCGDEDVFSKSDAKAFRAADLKVIKSGVMQTEPHQVEMAGGTRWLEVTRSPFIDDAGEVTGLLWSARDRTAFKQMEDAVRDSEGFFSALGEDQTELTCRFGTDFGLTFANEAVCRFAGKKRDEMLGQPFFTLLHPEAQAAIEKAAASLTGKKPVATIETHAVPKGGKSCLLQWIVRALFNAEGKPEQYQAVGRDVTELKQAVEASTAQAQRVQELEKLAADASARVQQSENALKERESQLAGQLAEARQGVEDAQRQLAEKEGRLQQMETRLRNGEDALASIAQLGVAASDAANLSSSVVGLMAKALNAISASEGGSPSLDQSKLQELHSVLQKVNGFVEQMRARLG
jgi:PAS domain S-box-containing protein